MALFGKKLAVAFPDTILEEKDTPRDKTIKLGTIARTCSIYGVDVIEVFGEDGRPGEAALIKQVLDYLETPQYLRRRLFPIAESLRFAGLLPPLRIPSHRPKVAIDKLNVGEVREGVTNADGTVDIGLDRNPRVAGKVGSNMRVTVRLSSKEPLTAEVIARDEVEEYWGYAVEVKRLGDVFADQRFGLKVATSRMGKDLKTEAAKLTEAIRRATGVKLIFGSPSRGLFDIAGPELPNKVGFVINLFPGQHVETVRTEEAISAALNTVAVLGI